MFKIDERVLKIENYQEFISINTKSIADLQKYTEVTNLELRKDIEGNHSKNIQKQNE